MMIKVEQQPHPSGDEENRSNSGMSADEEADVFSDYDEAEATIKPKRFHGHHPSNNQSSLDQMNLLSPSSRPDFHRNILSSSLSSKNLTITQSS